MEHWKQTKLEKCTDWLVNLLAESETALKPSDVVELGERAGFSLGMIYRARRDLGERIVNTDGHQSPKNLWKLAE